MKRFFHALPTKGGYNGSPLYRVDTHVGYEEPLTEWQGSHAIQENGEWALFDNGEPVNIKDVYVQMLS